MTAAAQCPQTKLVLALTGRLCSRPAHIVQQVTFTVPAGHLLQVHKAKLRRKKFSRRQRKQAAAYSQHLVAPGDDLASIARANGVLVSDVERLNTGECHA